MAWSIGTVTLPYGPTQISDEVDCHTETFDVDGAEDILFATGKGVRTVTWTGFIHEAAHTKSNLSTDYAAPLRAYQGTTQSIVGGNTGYSGTALVKKVAIREQAEGDKVIRIFYTIVLQYATTIVVL